MSIKAALSNPNAFNIRFRAALERRLGEVGEELVKRAKENLVANDSVDTGNLKESISYVIKPKDGEIIVTLRVPKYGIYLEYGTGVYAEGGNGRKTQWRYQRDDGGWITTEGNAPKPFLRPALADREALVSEACREALLEAFGG